MVLAWTLKYYRGGETRSDAERIHRLVNFRLVAASRPSRIIPRLLHAYPLTCLQAAFSMKHFRMLRAHFCLLNFTQRNLFSQAFIFRWQNPVLFKTEQGRRLIKTEGFTWIITVLWGTLVFQLNRIKSNTYCGLIQIVVGASRAAFRQARLPALWHCTPARGIHLPALPTTSVNAITARREHHTPLNARLQHQHQSILPRS